MEMHQIRYFLAAARTLNFTQAADECHVAQPSLSRAIRNLEDELGGDLFRRERSLTHLTDLGLAMLPILTRAYESAVAAKTLATSYKKGNSPPLRLALSHTTSLALLVPALTELMKVFPSLELKFLRGTAADLAEALKGGQVEMAFAGPLGVAWDRLDRWALFDEAFDLVVSARHPLAMRPCVGLDQLNGHRLLCRGYCEQAAALSECLKRHGIEPKTGDQILSDPDLVALLEANVGIGILPRSTALGTNLRALPLDGLDLKRSISVYAVAGRERSPAGAALLKLVRAADWSKLIEKKPDVSTAAAASAA